MSEGVKMNALTILRALDDRLESTVELTLYGRAALQLGFQSPPPEALLSRDVDAVFGLGEAEELAEKTDFWEAVDVVNRDLEDRNLYVSHFFAEDQVVMRPSWKRERIALSYPFNKLRLFRLADLDLLLTKLMRHDPQDHKDALFIARSARLDRATIEKAISEARIPPVPEIQEQFTLATDHLLKTLAGS